MDADLGTSSTPELDFLLQQVAESLQLPQTDYELMKQSYKAVTEWLEAPGSPLATRHPRLYPQGSVAIETTVRPLRRDDFDLDFVCQLETSGKPAGVVYQEVLARLQANARYAPMIEQKNRCVRLNYARDFHMDIIPAEPAIVLGGTNVRVPDRAMRDWTPSNPLGYVAWFKQHAERQLVEARKAHPLPTQTPAREKETLEVAVQLIKRRRDVMFATSDAAPRSILLTTLAAETYAGHASVAAALQTIAFGIRQRIAMAAPGRLEVWNPTTVGERFSESLDAPERYEAFDRFIRQLEHDAQRMVATTSIAALKQLLAEMFGEAPVTGALEALAKRQRQQREGGTLQFSSQGRGALGVVAATAGMSQVPRHQYHRESN